MKKPKKALKKTSFFVQCSLILCRNDILQKFCGALVNFQEIMNLQSFKFHTRVLFADQICTFTEEILNGKNILCGETYIMKTWVNL